MVKLNTNSLILAGAAGLGLVVAWETNFLGIRDLFDSFAEGADGLVYPEQQGGPPQYPSLAELNYYKDNPSSYPQQTHTQQYPFPYPYPPTGYPQTVAPLTLPGAHYQLAGTPNIRQIPGTTTIMSPPTASMPNPTLWWDKGGIVTPGTRIALPSEINYGPYQFQSPIFSSNRYPVYGSNIDYPFIVGPIAPSPCPYGEYRAGDGRCYRLGSPPPESCPIGQYRASDGRCYSLLP